MRILLAEDERDLNQLIVQKLKSEGYSVDSVENGEDAIQITSYTEYDAVILDIMMPKVDGYGVLQAMRSRGDGTPVMFLTARDAVEDRVKGLDGGANDYLVKPFSFEELMARVRAMTRSSFGISENRLVIGDLIMDCNRKKVTRGGQEIRLSAKEYALLEYLMFHEGIVLSREKIENHIWDYDYEGGTNVVDVYISYLRKKIDGNHKKKLIHTIRGQGYTLREEADG